MCLLKQRSNSSLRSSEADTSTTSSNGIRMSTSVLSDESVNADKNPVEEEYPDIWTREEIAQRKLTVPQLKVILKQKGLAVSGTKETVTHP